MATSLIFGTEDYERDPRDVEGPEPECFDCGDTGIKLGTEDWICSCAAGRAVREREAAQQRQVQADVLRLERACREAAHRWTLQEQLEATLTLVRLRERLGLPVVLASGRVQWNETEVGDAA